MITFLVCDFNRAPLQKLISKSHGYLPKMQVLDYTQAFRKLSVPSGTLVFTDFDLLSDFELDAAGSIAAAAGKDGAHARILNHPLRTRERFALLSSLHANRLNAVQVTRLETGEKPGRYPVFIRLERGCIRPDTGLLHDETEFDAALADMMARGRTLRGRIAVSFEASCDRDGYYRKYGAFRIGDHIVPQHILRDREWIVKSNRAHIDDAFIAEELDFVKTMPHRDELMRVFEQAGYEFGRIDYTVRGNEVVVFEINPNPTFPRFKGGDPARGERRTIIVDQLAEAFASIDSDGGFPRIPFTPEPAIGRYIVRRRWNGLDRLLFKSRLKRRHSAKTQPKT